MGISEKISKLRALALFHIKNRGGEVLSVKIPEIPNKWSKFQDTNDLWIKINYPEDSNLTGCLYKGQGGTIFNGHRHLDNIEQFTILNEGGRIITYTEETSKEMIYGDSVTFKKGESHLVEFMEDTMISIIWHPKMEGWNAEFISEEE